MSKIEQELLDQTKLKPKSKEERAKFLKRVFAGSEALFSDDNKDAEKNWEKVSEAAQGWYKKACKADEAGDDMPEFPDYEAPKDDDAKDETSDASNDEDNMTTKKNGKKKKNDDSKSKTKAAAKDKPAKKEAAPKAPKKKREGGKVEAILSIILKNPTKKTLDLHEMLVKKGGEASASTVSTVRSDFIRACNFLEKEGLLKNNPFNKD